MSASLLLNLVHPEMKMSEKFDFVENYLQRIAGGEFFRSVKGSYINDVTQLGGRAVTLLSHYVSRPKQNRHDSVTEGEGG